MTLPIVGPFSVHSLEEEDRKRVYRSFRQLGPEAAVNDNSKPCGGFNPRDVMMPRET